MATSHDSLSPRIKEVLQKLLALDPSQRAALIDEAVEGDLALRAQIEQLLDEYDRALEFVSRFPTPFLIADGRAPSSRMFADGDIVAERFHILGLLGAGGMGEVYKAEDRAFRGDRVALKTVRASLAADERAVERLKNEIRLARQITHPNVCRVHDVYEHQTTSGGRLSFFSMELLEGDTLAARLAGSRLTTDAALPVVRQIAEAIDAIHLSKVAHGDLKPNNIMLVPANPSPEKVVVTDFGLARWLPVNTTLLSTPVDGGIWGALPYMAPEQLFGGQATEASDIYALGVICYEMVTGRVPFASDAPMFLAIRKARESARLPPDVAHALDARWQAAILRCLDANPGKRFKLATDFVRAIERRAVRRWLIAGTAGAALTGVIAGAIVENPDLRQSIAAIGRRSRAPTAEQTVAVLPFTRDERTPDGDALA